MCAHLRRYITVALSSLPRGAHWRALLVRSRLGLGIGGVVIVAASVTAALGEQGCNTDLPSMMGNAVMQVLYIA